MNRFVSSSLSALAVVGATVASVTPAQAFSLSINPQYGSTENTGATAALNFNFVQQGANVQLNLGIQNTTNGTVGLGATQATLVGVAFDLLEGVQVSNYNSGTSGFTQLWANPDLQPFGSFDVGISPPRNSFAGGNPQSGLTAGQVTAVSFLLSGNNLNAATLESNFLNGFSNGSLRLAGRFQQVNAGGGSDKVLGGGGSTAAVPEPSTMVGLAIAGAALLNRKKLQRKAD